MLSVLETQLGSSRVILLLPSYYLNKAVGYLLDHDADNTAKTKRRKAIAPDRYTCYRYRYYLWKVVTDCVGLAVANIFRKQVHKPFPSSTTISFGPVTGLAVKLAVIVGLVSIPTVLDTITQRGMPRSPKL